METRSLVSYSTPPPRQPPLVYPRTLKMSVQATVFGVSLDDIKSQYAANDFLGAFRCFVIHFRSPELSLQEVVRESEKLRIQFQKLSAFHRIKFVTQDPYSVTPTADIVVGSIHCEPAFKDKYGRVVPGRFDTAIVNTNHGGHSGVKGMPLLTNISLLFDSFQVTALDRFD